MSRMRTRKWNVKFFHRKKKRKRKDEVVTVSRRIRDFQKSSPNSYVRYICYVLQHLVSGSFASPINVVFNFKIHKQQQKQQRQTAGVFITVRCSPLMSTTFQF